MYRINKANFVFKMIRILLILFLGLFTTQLQQALADPDNIEGYLAFCQKWE
jgi:hypothetical protein